MLKMSKNIKGIVDEVQQSYKALKRDKETFPLWAVAVPVLYKRLERSSIDRGLLYAAKGYIQTQYPKMQQYMRSKQEQHESERARKIIGGHT